MLGRALWFAVLTNLAVLLFLPLYPILLALIRPYMKKFWKWVFDRVDVAVLQEEVERMYMEQHGIL
jgi:hypothetical protein